MRRTGRRSGRSRDLAWHHRLAPGLGTLPRESVGQRPSVPDDGPTVVEVERDTPVVEHRKVGRRARLAGGVGPEPRVGPDYLVHQALDQDGWNGAASGSADWGDTPVGLVAPGDGGGDAAAAAR
ncbi:MAG: hypothetical protein AVDCRST_MAG59-1357 [uncultured Thermomicrobiales bacterium]|uniref:Uncharacterized protein n=1 Tax=uncultured Thermomicrobiales bacterium TaxID=1645740 RepID=A0A6J4UF02_9BACT|nr:MAG: hypothetical protein AVDCRST_MAG59-1357 [uncultured Thermomicrobiales bacterium]